MTETPAKDKPDPAPAGFAPHDHDRCKATGLEAVETACATGGLRLTPVRRRVMEVLLSDHRAFGAYEILDVLARDGLGRQPPVAYRALDFLVEHGFAHRIGSQSAYAACTHPGTDHAPIFLICTKCGRVIEDVVHGLGEAVARAAARAGFEASETSVETLGLCPACAAPADDGGG